MNPGTRWILRHDSKTLLRLTSFCPEYFSLFYDFIVEFIEITPQEWDVAYEQDPRDVPWVFVDQDGFEQPYSSFLVTWVADENRISLKYAPAFQTVRSDMWTRIKALFGIPPEIVPLERAPMCWGPARPRSILKRLKSSDSETVYSALDELGMGVSAEQAEWASDILLSHAYHEDPIARRLVLNGIGELARVHGYVNASAAASVIRDALKDPTLRRHALIAMDEVARFAGVRIET